MTDGPANGVTWEGARESGVSKKTFEVKDSMSWVRLRCASGNVSSTFYIQSLAKIYFAEI